MDRSTIRVRHASVAAVIAASMAIVPVAAAAQGAATALVPPVERELATLPAVADPDVDRQLVPEDEYAMALGCYEIVAHDGTGIGIDGAAYGATGTPFHFEPTRLGQYLLLDTAGTLVQAAKGAAEQGEDVVQDVEFHAPVGRDTHLTRSFVDDDAPAPLADHTLGGNLPDAPDTHTGAVVPGEAGPSADWRVRQNTDGSFTFLLDAADGRALSWDGGTLVLADAATAGATTNFSLRNVDADGCAVWPEVELNVTGPVLAGETPWDETRGTIDAHLHLMTFEFLGGELRCGRPWHPYGVTEALGDCTNNQLTGYSLAESTAGRGPGDGTDTMWPDFTVPQSNTLTYEQVYHRWLERAWRSGLRMMTVLLTENAALCETFPYRRNSCNEMDAVRLQRQRLDEFIDFLDARAGGPGEGFAQIARTPFEAREIINSGRLAFIVGIETSTPFDCGEILGVSQCTNEQILTSLDEVQALDVAQMEILNKFDNAFTGVTGDPGTTGVIVNSGNRKETGHYWQMETCPAEEDRRFGTDKRQLAIGDEAEGTPFEPVARDPLAGMVLAAAGHRAGAPAYPAGPHCNARGLTDQGVFLLQEMAARGMLFDPDHMSARAATAALDVMEELGYKGIISSHSWANDTIYERVYPLGGMITPYAGGASGFVNAWHQRLGWVDDRYYFGFGYGADTNGLGGQGGPRFRGQTPPPGEGVEYPFVAPGGAVVDRQVSGNRTFDINQDGVAMYGMYGDWVEDIRVIAENRFGAGAGDELMQDMLRGPEMYIQVWERAVGVPDNQCIFGDGVTDLTDGLEEGMTLEQVLRTAGQPQVRGPEGYTFCSIDDRGEAAQTVVRFGPGGLVDDIQELPLTAPLPALNRPRGAQAVASADGSVTTAARTDVTHVHDASHGHGHTGDAAGGETDAHELETDAEHADGSVAAAGATEAAMEPAAATGSGVPLLAVLAGLALLVVARVRGAGRARG